LGKRENSVRTCCWLNWNRAIWVGTRAQGVMHTWTACLRPSLPVTNTHRQTTTHSLSTLSDALTVRVWFQQSAACQRKAELWLTVRREQRLADRISNKGKCQFACVTCRQLTRGKEKLKMKHSCQFRSTASPKRF